MEGQFWKSFGDRVFEWNPSFSDSGEQRFRFHWDPDVEAHDIEVDMPAGFDESEPCRSNLRSVLDGIIDAMNNGRSVDLRPVRRLVSALVQKYGRHDRHGLGAPKIGKHPCARGDAKCVFCRYGFPRDLRSRSGTRPMAFEKGERKGQWHARFPCNDRLCCSYEQHMMLANMGNIGRCGVHHEVCYEGCFRI